MSAQLTPGLNDVEECGAKRKSALYKKDVL